MRSILLAAGVALAAFTVGCEDDEAGLRADNVAGASGSAGTAGNGGSSGEAGSGGESGSAGTAGSGGESGSAGTAGSGGTGGTGPVSPEIPGLNDKVTATYDEFGFLHLACKTDDDCFAAMGYFHAANRLFFMDFVRNLVRGKLASLVMAGDLVLGQDFTNRQYFSTPQGEPLESALVTQADAQTKAQLTAYTRGVNAWLDDMRNKRNGATLTTEYDFALIVKENIRDWELEDSAAVGLYVMNDLSDFSGDEIALSANMAALGTAFASDLYSLRPTYSAYILPSAGGQPPAPAPAPLWDNGAAERVKNLQGLMSLIAPATAFRLDPLAARERGAFGSNNWVVAPSRTTGGKALLANDPHLGLTNPSIWFPVEIDAKSNGGTGQYHMAGGSFPGLPAVLTGHNEKIAWGVTTAYWDLSDEYVEEVSADGKSVKFNGQNVAIVEKEVEFYDASTKKTVKKTLRWVPHHGPIVSEDTVNHTAVTVRWVAHDGSTDMQSFMKLGRAETIEEARTALTDMTSADQNFVIFDSEGSIGWFPYSKVPRRPWASPALAPWLLLPGDGSAEWDGFVSLDKLPQSVNPAIGVIATANNEMTGAWADGDPTNDGQEAIQAWSKAEGARAQRIVDMLAEGGNAHTTETMRTMQGDTYMIIADVLVPLMLDAAGDALGEDAAKVADALTGWARTCPTGLQGADPNGPKSTDAAVAAASIGCTAFHTTLFSLLDAAVGDELKAANASAGTDDKVSLIMRSVLVPETLHEGEKFWDDVSTPDIIETRAMIVQKAFDVAATKLAVLGGPDEWRWGRVHTLTLRSIYDNFGVNSYNEGPYATPGGLLTVNVANPSSTKNLAFGQTSGPSLRTIIEQTASGPVMKFQYPGGADLHRDSPFYNNLVARWLVNEPVDFVFGAGAVTQPAKTIEISPK